MILNYIWIGFFVISFIVATIRFILGDLTIFSQIMESIYSASKTGFELSLGLTGVLSLWLGILKIGEAGGMIKLFSKITSPLFSRLFPDIPKGHPSSGSILMNLSANMLGLDNAATPFGLKAMQQLQDINPNKNKASNSMIMFIVINASGLTLIPVTVMVFRAQLGAADPADIFIPISLATFLSTLGGIVAVCLKQKINILNKNIITFFAIILSFILSIILLFKLLPEEKANTISGIIANIILFSIIILFIVKAIFSKINIFESFIEGAKDGFKTAITIIPYLIAVLIGIAAFKSSGVLDFLMDSLKSIIASIGIENRWVDGLPTAIMKPLSGSGARGMMIETMKTFGADSFAGRLSCIFQGASDTTFYIVALYYGAIKIKNSRYTIPYALFADLIGIISAIFICYIFFG